MAVYAYEAMDLDASSVSGTVIADTPRQARDILRARGLTVTAVEVLRASSRASDGRPRRLRSQTEVVVFIRELASLLAVGIPLLDALHTLARQHLHGFKACLQDLADQVAGGAGLAEAMSRRPEYFDEMTVSVVQVGETTGALDATLRQLAAFKEKGHRLRGRVITALVYPAIVLFVGLAVTVFLMTYVVPTLLDTLLEAGRELPAITRGVKAISDFLLAWWWALLTGLAGVALMLKAVLMTDRGQYLAHRSLLGIPVVGTLIRKETTSRVAVVLGALLRSGLQFVDAVQITRRTVRNRVFGRALEDYEAAVAAGRDVAAALEATGVFSPMVVQMLAVGQETGELEAMLAELADSYDLQVDTMVRRLSALLEPVLIVLLAVMVGFVAFATILPILEASHVL